MYRHRLLTSLYQQDKHMHRDMLDYMTQSLLDYCKLADTQIQYSTDISDQSLQDMTALQSYSNKLQYESDRTYRKVTVVLK